MSTVSNLALQERQALQTIAAFEGDVIVDLDETLYLRNSTEEFIDCARPAPLAACLLKALEILKPWRLLGGAATRDVWRVRVVQTFFPWTKALWEKRCKQEAAAQTNVALLETLRQKEKPFTIATLGFAPIVKPLIEAMGCGDAPLVACRLRKAVDRRAGKAALVEKAIGGAALSQAMVVTDSTDDNEILERCRLPLLTRWSQARYRPAFHRTFLPTDYMTRIKYPRMHALRKIFVEDFALWVLGALSAVSIGLPALASLLFFFVSFWCVYEIGYRDNDLCAERLESDPALKEEYAAFDMPHFEEVFWLYAVFFGALGTLVQGGPAPIVTALSWLGVLAGLRTTYYVYNRVDKQTRVWLYLVLQLFRCLAFVAIVPVGAIGVMAGLATVMARWIAYYLYRYMRHFDVFEWPEIPQRAIRLVLFVCFTAPLLVVTGVTSLQALSLGALLLWQAALARKELFKTLRAIHWLPRACGERTPYRSTSLPRARERAIVAKSRLWRTVRSCSAAVTRAAMAMVTLV